MVSRIKLYSKLDTLEEELKLRLVQHLKVAERGENDLIFCVTAFNPHKELRRSTDKTTETLIDIGAQILTLREKLKEPTEKTIAARICWYCREWASNRDNKVPVRALAAQFLNEILESELNAS